jgi:beta-glucosidase
MNTAVEDLRYAKGWAGRLFASALKLAYNFLRLVGNHKMAGVLMMGVCNMPLRGLSRMTGGAISQRQLDGLITMFNGKFFKGLGQFFSKKA